MQVGDPFTEKLLIEACLEIYEAGLVVGIQDLGGAGLDLRAHRDRRGRRHRHGRQPGLVQLREASMEPHEILASESQERMLLIVEPRKLDAVLAVAERWGVIASAIGEVTAGTSDNPGRLVITWHGDMVVDVPPGFARRRRPGLRPPDARAAATCRCCRPTGPRRCPGRRAATSCGRPCCRWSPAPTCATSRGSPSSTTGTCWATPCSPSRRTPGVLRVDEQTGLGIALSVDGNGRYARLDPYGGAQLALAEAYRNVAVTGATPIAVTNCLNFGSPEDPRRDVAVRRGGARARRRLPGAGHPGHRRQRELLQPDRRGTRSTRPRWSACSACWTTSAQRVPMGFSGDGDVIFLLGETSEELSGSEWAWVDARAPRRPPARRSTWPPSSVLAGLLAEAAGNGH